MEKATGALTTFMRIFFSFSASLAASSPRDCRTISMVATNALAGNFQTFN